MSEKTLTTLFFWLLLVSGAAVLLAVPASADSPAGPGGKPFVTIVAEGSGAYYLGEMVTLQGQNTDSGTTYVFITGPNIPQGGAKLTAPQKAVVTGNPDTFTAVKTRADKTWEYSFYTAGLPYDAGSYTLYAVSNPVAVNQFNDSTTYGTASIIIKKPFITATISPDSVVKGRGFAVTGFAEGEPPEVQIWIIGTNTFSTARAPVNQDASFTFTGAGTMTQNLDPGQYWLFVQHPMQNNRFDINLSGGYVRNGQQNDTILFKVSGPGSLQGSDAAEALLAAFSDPAMLNVDTYTVIPFQVTGAGSSAPPVTAATTVPAQRQAPSAPLQYAAPIGAGALLVLGIVLWKWH